MGGGRGKSPKTLFFFRGKRHDNQILKVQILLSRNFVVIAQAPIRANFVLTKDQKRPYYGLFWVKHTGRGLVVKRPGVLSKVQMLNLVLGVGVFSLLPNLF